MTDPSPIETDPSRVNVLRALVCDVDGTLTDGSILISPQGEEIKRFDVRDGLGIAMALRAGIGVFFLSSRPSPAVQRRARELGVTGCVTHHRSKVRGYDELCERHGLEDRHICYIGDDLTDLVLVRRAMLGVAVGDAHEVLQRTADLVCENPGGHGAVRETIELILKVRGDWERLVRELDPDSGADL